MMFCSVSSYKNLLWALFITVAVSGVTWPTRAELFPQASSGPIALTDAEEQKITEQARQLVDLLSRGEYAQARSLLHPDLASQLTTEEIKEIWDNLLSKTGKVQKQGTFRVIDAVNSDLVVIPTQFERGSGDFIITFNEDEQIVGVDFPRAESIAEISQKVIDSLAARKFVLARGYLHPLLKTEIFPEKLQQGWDRLQEQYGPFKRVVSTNIRSGSSVDDAEVVVLTLEFAKSTQDILMIFDGDRHITGFNFVE